MASRKSNNPIVEESVTVTIPLSVAHEVIEVLMQRTIDCHERVRMSGADSEKARKDCDHYARCANILRNAVAGRWPARP